MSIVTRICEFCEEEYQNVYFSAHKNPYTMPTRFCSKSCAGKHGYLTRKGNIDKPLPTKEVILEEIRDCIQSKSRYCTSNEIRNHINRSSKTLVNLGISITEENAKYGYTNHFSAFERSVGEVLSCNFDVVEVQKKFDGLVGSKGHPLRVDFYLPDYGLAIEADGEQHYRPDRNWFFGSSNGTVQEYDEIKDNYFENSDMNLVRIPYKRRVSEDYVMGYIQTVDSLLNHNATGNGNREGLKIRRFG